MHPTEMTPADALKILTDVTARVPLVRADQQTVLTAIETLRVAIAPEVVKGVSPE